MTPLQVGDYFWIDNSENNDLPNWNYLARVTRLNHIQGLGQYHIDATIVLNEISVTCWDDTNSGWGIGRKAVVKLKGKHHE